MGTLATALTGSNWRTSVLVSLVLALALTCTGFLSSAYKNARNAQGQRHFFIGESLRKAGNVQGAADEYRKALLFLPDETEYQLSLAMSLIELGHLNEAESRLQELLETDPTSGIVNLLLARIAERQHNAGQAIDYLQRAVYGYWPQERASQRHSARWELVRLLDQENKQVGVVGELLQLAANAPDDSAERLKIGYMLLAHGATTDALNIFREVTRDRPTLAQAHRALGEAYLKSGDYPEARRAFQRALHFNARDPESLRLLAAANAVLDLDPALPRLNMAERYRRSRLILDRVLTALSTCDAAAAGGNAAGVNQEIETAQGLMKSVNADKDATALAMQDAAEQLWKNRFSICKSTPEDAPLQSVLAKLGQ